MSGSGSKVLKSTEMTGSISKILQTPYQGDVPARKCSSNHAVEAVKCCNNRGEEDCNHMEGSSSKTADNNMYKSVYKSSPGNAAKQLHNQS